MTMTNHLLAGAVLSFAVGRPELVLPLAFVSHFVLDSVPHYGEGRAGVEYQPTEATLTMYTVDALAASALVLFLALHAQWFALACALVAFSPDLVWLYRAVKKALTGESKPRSAFSRFHEKIQREYMWGWVLEFVLALIFVAILLSHVPA